MQAKHQGLLPTLIVLLVVAGALTLIGIVIWMRMTPKTAPTQPPRATGSLRYGPPEGPKLFASGRHLT